MKCLLIYTLDCAHIGVGYALGSIEKKKISASLRTNCLQPLYAQTACSLACARTVMGWIFQPRDPNDPDSLHIIERERERREREKTIKRGREGGFSVVRLSFVLLVIPLGLGFQRVALIIHALTGGAS